MSREVPWITSCSPSEANGREENWSTMLGNTSNLEAALYGDRKTNS